MDINWLYILGLALAILYLLMGFDDFLWDFSALFLKFKTKKNKLNMSLVNDTPPKLIAIMIAAWQEDNVLGSVIENFIESTLYPSSMYHIFLGVYPNDKATLNVSRELSAAYCNVHTVINSLPGPTSKAQNINYVIHMIKNFEENRGWNFASFTVHDSEDVVHPYELKITNYLIGRQRAVQFPVFPLIELPRFRNFFKNLTTSTYADEFAENHFLTMVNRNNMGAFVPSAGTGFSLAREVIESFGDTEILPSNSLTEDYRLSLTLYEMGIPLYYVLERIPRVNEKYHIVYDYVSTRSMFPKTFQTAVRQKTRWIMGITMQTLNFREIFKKQLKFSGRYSLYKDQKAKIGNLVVFIGYPIFLYFLFSIFTELPAIYPKYSFSWYLSILVTVMMLERQIFRGISVYHIYGMRSVFFSCLFPPVLPIRIIWGNAINFTATLKSYRQKYCGSPKTTGKRKQKAVTKESAHWDKTEHTFLEKNILKRYHRKIGDILIERNLITPKQLSAALKDIHSQETPLPLGRYLLKRGELTEAQFLECLAQLTNHVFLQTDDFHEFYLSGSLSYDCGYTLEQLKKYRILPIMQKDGEAAIAVSEYSSKEALSGLLERNDTVVCFASSESILCGIKRLLRENDSTKKISPDSIIEELYLNNKIDMQQALLAKSLRISKKWDEKEVLLYMGLLKDGPSR